MSKRFGRNQKRKLKAELLQETRKRELYSEHWHEAKNERKELIKRIKRYLGKYSSVLPELPVIRVDKLGTCSKMDLQTVYPEILYLDSGNAEQPLASMINTAEKLENMLNFVVCVENIPFDCKKLITFKEIRGRTGSACYVLSETQFNAFGFDPKLLKPLSEDIARGLINIMHEQSTRK